MLLRLKLRLTKLTKLPPQGDEEETDVTLSGVCAGSTRLTSDQSGAVGRGTCFAGADMQEVAVVVGLLFSLLPGDEGSERHASASSGGISRGLLRLSGSCLRMAWGTNVAACRSTRPTRPPTHLESSDCSTSKACSKCGSSASCSCTALA